MNVRFIKYRTFCIYLFFNFLIQSYFSWPVVSTINYLKIRQNLLTHQLVRLASDVIIGITFAIIQQHIGVIL